MARELSLDEYELQTVFEAFPGIFRRSLHIDETTGQHMFSLQARYAQRTPSEEADTSESYIAPLEADRIGMILDFIQQASAQEVEQRRALIGNTIAVIAAVISAAAAVIVAIFS